MKIHPRVAVWFEN